jgi:hypothetical protein
VEEVNETDHEPHSEAWIGAGERACPPEDVGGTHGYAEMLRAPSLEPDSDEAKRYRTWPGDDFDAELFDRRAANSTPRAWSGRPGQKVDGLAPVLASDDRVCFN